MKKHQKNRPLPKPPATPFERNKRALRDEQQEPLTSDRLAQAAAEGRLDEFLKEEMPDNEYARNLATMMMGMTGIVPPAATPEERQEEQEKQRPKDQEGQEETAAFDVLEDVRQAIQGGDVQGLMDMLRREHRKRNPEAAGQAPEEAAQPEAQNQPAVDKDLIDALIRIAQDNGVSLDWIILRAIKVYVQEYRKTGKL